MTEWMLSFIQLSSFVLNYRTIYHSFLFYFFCFPWQSASRYQQMVLLAKQAVPICQHLSKQQILISTKANFLLKTHCKEGGVQLCGQFLRLSMGKFPMSLKNNEIWRTENSWSLGCQFFNDFPFWIFHYFCNGECVIFCNIIFALTKLWNIQNRKKKLCFSCTNNSPL